MKINGYKAFNHDMTNNYGMKFEEGKTYKKDGNISFGIKGNGFHMCKNLEDTFRYIDDDDIKVAKVLVKGTIAEGFDEYNEYFDMYSVSEIEILHIMSRKEIIEEIIKKNKLKICRFITTGFKLTDNEAEMIRLAFPNSRMISSYIDYYAYGNKDAFSEEKAKVKSLNNFK
jgi:hypothetical protein